MPALLFNTAPLDSYAERITIGIAGLGSLLTLPALFLFLSGLLRDGFGVTGALVTAATAAVLVVWLMLNYAVQPINYAIEDDQITIRRRWGRPVRVPMKEIAGVSLASVLGDVPRFGLRRSFNAGVFGYQGPFQLDPYGSVFFMATNRERLVAVARSNGLTLILSPARPRDFVESLREALIRKAELADTDE